MAIQRPLFNEALQSISSGLFTRSPGLTLNDLVHLEPHQKFHLSHLEEDVSHAQSRKDHFKLAQIALQLIQRSPNSTLYKIISNSPLISELLSEKRYNALWNNRLGNHDQRSKSPTLHTHYQQWQLIFLKEQYLPWKESPLAYHASVSSLKQEIQRIEMITDNHNQLRPSN
ncbi:MAG: hypothetical protein CL816_05795 [Coxiellaceae bacterium]|nr:hypothetical protein [Coxiellaceae bacterium]